MFQKTGRKSRYYETIQETLEIVSGPFLSTFYAYHGTADCPYTSAYFKQLERFEPKIDWKKLRLKIKE